MGGAEDGEFAGETVHLHFVSVTWRRLESTGTYHGLLFALELLMELGSSHGPRVAERTGAGHGLGARGRGGGGKGLVHRGRGQR